MATRATKGKAGRTPPAAKQATDAAAARGRQAEALVIWHTRTVGLIEQLLDAVQALRSEKNADGTVASEVYHRSRLGEVETDLETLLCSFTSAAPSLPPAGFVPPPGVPS